MYRSRVSLKAPRILSVALSFVALSCGPATEFYRGVEINVAGGNFIAAIDEVRSNAKGYGDKSTVLFKLDMGLLFHYAGMSDSSNEYLFAAEREIEDLFTKSVSLTAISMVLNDNVLPYEGEDFEKVLVNVFLALNYVRMNQPDEALVEARKVDLKLREFDKKYEGKNKYQEDAFVRYLMGVLYESAGEINDAFISYRQAHETYEVYGREYGTREPSFLLDDLVRTATLMSFDTEAAEYRAMGGAPYERNRMQFGSLVVLAYAGLGPIKQEVHPQVSIADDDGVVHTFQVALPKFVPRFPPGRRYEVVADALDSSRSDTSYTEVGEDVSAISARTLEDRMTLEYLKSGGRALLKFLASEKAKAELAKNKEDKFFNFLKSLAVDIAVGATEHADLRTWRTLPAEFQITRLNLAPAKYQVHATATDGKYVLPSTSVTIRARQTTFLIINDVR